MVQKTETGEEQMADKKTSDQIAKNVAAKTAKISNKKAATQELANRREEMIEFLDSLPVKIRAQTLAFSLAQIAAAEIPDKKEAKEIVDLFKSKPFVHHMARIIESSGIEGAFDEMTELDLDDPAAILELFTGEEFSDEEIQEVFGEQL